MDFRQPTFLFLKAAFVFGRFGERRSRRDSFLSFRSLLAEATFPSGKVIRSVTHLVPACLDGAGGGIRLWPEGVRLLRHNDRHQLLAAVRDLIRVPNKAISLLVHGLPRFFSFLAMKSMYFFKNRLQGCLAVA
jgi:hypothetical protein